MPGIQRRPAASASTAATTGVDVAVIGGGPGGLAAAHALAVAMPALHIAVYERVPALIKRGAGIALDPNGQKALRAINPGMVGYHYMLLSRACAQQLAMYIVLH